MVLVLASPRKARAAAFCTGGHAPLSAAYLDTGYTVGEISVDTSRAHCWARQ